MQTTDLYRYIAQNPYPGRGVLMGLCPGGTRAVAAYFIMGRSANSRNRVFTEKDGGIVTEAADPAKMENPSLVIYAPVRVASEHTIVTNGDQTDTIYNNLAVGGSFEAALRQRTFEPDGPNYTPRISGMMSLGLDGITYRLSILKAAGGNPASVQRFFYDYPQPLAGTGHIIHTYGGDGSPLPAYEGEPAAVALENNIDSLGQALWNALNGENKVSLFVRTLNLDGKTETRIYNKYSKI
jgi:phosphoribosylglycinamide formyltransferase-1